MAIVVRFVGETYLEATAPTERSLIGRTEFLAAWKDLLPEGWRDQVSLDKIQVGFLSCLVCWHLLTSTGLVQLARSHFYLLPPTVRGDQGREFVRGYGQECTKLARTIQSPKKIIAAALCMQYSTTWKESKQPANSRP